LEAALARASASSSADDGTITEWPCHKITAMRG
jgi:hypothetical protein